MSVIQSLLQRLVMRLERVLQQVVFHSERHIELFDRLSDEQMLQVLRLGPLPIRHTAVVIGEHRFQHILSQQRASTAVIIT